MARHGKTVLAVIPARGGSKSIPRKNLCPLAGRSLVARAADTALALAWIDRAIISTDDEEIAAEARRAGLDCPFMRPPALAGDRAGSADMWRHAWLSAEEHYGGRFDISVLLEPTSPLRRPEDIEAAVDLLIESGRKAVATVSPNPAHFTPQKTLTLNDEGTIGFFPVAGGHRATRQEIPDYFHKNGVCYALQRATLVDEGHIVEDDCAALVIERPLVNIDEPFELELAEWLLARENAQSASS